MPDGAAVIKYDGKRGAVWRVKYRDADGRQIQETLGRAADGWTKRKAEVELRARLTAVEKDGLRKVEPERFDAFAREWLASYTVAKGLKRSTEQSYKQIIEPHLIPAFGALDLESLDVRRIETYVATSGGSAMPRAPLTGI
jgi:Phage integrase, N-terminal SAM-like domain